MSLVWQLRTLRLRTDLRYCHRQHATGSGEQPSDHSTVGQDDQPDPMDSERAS
jgi:hypothetical protein